MTEAPIGRWPVFVYGTLRPGQPGFDELGMDDRVDRLGPAMVAGTLYDLGEYPGAILQGAGGIVGELLLPRDDGVLPVLDKFELYDATRPAQSEYRRVAASTRHGSSVWIYVYNLSLKDASPILSGDWMDRDGSESNGPSQK